MKGRSVNEGAQTEEPAVGEAEEESETGTVRRHGRRLASGRNWFSSGRRGRAAGNGQDAEVIQ